MDIVRMILLWNKTVLLQCQNYYFVRRSRFKLCLRTWLLGYLVAVERLHVEDLHAVGWVEGHWSLVTPVRAISCGFLTLLIAKLHASLTLQTLRRSGRPGRRFRNEFKPDRDLSEVFKLPGLDERHDEVYLGVEVQLCQRNGRFSDEVVPQGKVVIEHLRGILTVQKFGLNLSIL